MLSELSSELETFIETSKEFIPFILTMVGCLWAFNYANWKTGARLNKFGIRPRRAKGLIGIVLAPFLHADFNHLLFNSLPLIVLSLFIITMGETLFYVVTFLLIILSGAGTWLFGRRGIHIGASGVIAGYFGFVLVSAYGQPTFASLFCAGVALYYFGGILLSLLPSEERVSWEGHLIGFIAGLVTFYLCKSYWQEISLFLYRLMG